VKVGIDARFLTHPQAGGFKTYCENLIRAVAEVDSDNAYVLYLDRAPGEQTAIPRPSNFRYRIVPGRWPVIGMPWREQVSLPRAARQDRLTVFHSPCLTAPAWSPCPLVVTVHDTIWMFPERFRSGPSSLKRRMMERYSQWAGRSGVRRAAAIITVSHAAAADITAHLHVDAAQLFVTHGAAGPAFAPTTDPAALHAVRRKYDLPPRYLLALGSADPRKNLLRLVRAYAELTDELRESHPLVIVWTNPFLAEQITSLVASLGVSSQVRFVMHVPTADLVSLYGGATLFVFPSLAEGFGLPPLEAMACGAPVIASDNTSMPEIVGEAALLVDAASVHSIAGALREGLSNPTLRRQMVERGLRRASAFTWQKCARETIAVYRRAAGRER